MPPTPGPPPPSLPGTLKLSNDLSQHVTRVRDALLALAGAAAERGNEATGRELLDLADTASAYWQAWEADVHGPLARLAFPPKTPAPTPSPAPDDIQATPQPRPRRAKRKAKPQPEGAR